MILRNGSVFTEELTFEQKDIYIQQDRIVAEQDYIPSATDEVVDADGLFVIPGLIDIHSHGAVGCDFSDGDTDGLKKILTYERQHGITTYCPTSMTLPLAVLTTAFRTLLDPSFFRLSHRTTTTSAAPYPSSTGYARIAGIHMEGPFIAESKKGAHKTEYITAADDTFFDCCQKAADGNIRLITIAPEIEANMTFIRQHAGADLTLSLGHTNCALDTAMESFHGGVSHLTHMFNAMAPLQHRDPGPIGAAMDCGNIYAELIADGIHVHDAMIRNAFRMFPEHICLISDSIRGCGLSDGSYELGGQTFHVMGKEARLSDGTIAGSVTNLYDSMLHAISIGVPKEQAIAAATMCPAKSIGIYHQVGSITPGKYADLLLVNKKMELQRVI